MPEHKVAIKICGLTNVEDALTCAAAGADLLGLNFSPRSLRCIGFETAAEIVKAVRAQFPKTKLVGVFLDQESTVVQQIATDLALDAVQLHGNESPAYVSALGALFVIKALRIADAASAARVSDYRCDAILLDTWSRKAPGGTGETFPWAIAAALRPRVPRLIMAGGLTSENVGKALQTVRPFAVDVCSGVESAPGRKDEAKVRTFIESVERFDDEKTTIRT